MSLADLRRGQVRWVACRALERRGDFRSLKLKMLTKGHIASMLLILNFWQRFLILLFDFATSIPGNLNIGGMFVRSLKLKNVLTHAIGSCK